jgi:ABC-type antimicrobial peptide transport system permease subunit
VAQLLPALAGSLLGIAGGIGIYDAAKNGPGPTTIPPALWLAGLVAGMPLAVAVLTAIPTRIAARRSPADVLQAETT